MLSISFKESKSKNFKEVLKLSRKFEGFNESTLNIEEIQQAFQAFQEENPGFETLLVLSSDGILEYSTDTAFCSVEDGKNLLRRKLIR